jgi:hypothetical protein
MKKGALVASLAVAISAVPASGGTLNFPLLFDEDNQPPTFLEGPLVLPNATLRNLTTQFGVPGNPIVSDTIYVNASFAFCFIGAGAPGLGSCDGSGEIVFNGPISNLQFDVSFWDSSDRIEITAFLGMQEVGKKFLWQFALPEGQTTFNGTIDLSAFGALDRLDFYDTSSAGGALFSKFRFEEGAVGVIPLPPALPMLGTALLGLGLIARRRRRA